MTIVYTLVAEKENDQVKPLVEYTEQTGNSAEICEKIVQQTNVAENGAASYQYEGYCFHIQLSNRRAFICMTDLHFSRRRAFGYLNEIVNRFSEYEIRPKDFRSVIKDRALFYSHDPEADKISKVQKEISDVKDVMKLNIDKVIERGEKLDVLVDKTDSLSQQAVQFRRKAAEVRRHFWWKNTRMIIIIVVLFLLILYGAIAIFCSPTFKC
eukprot:TRINITY_DN2049_c0_g1::TRINITY_DN2049_c0_g1_i1::g.21876::m.21876 TRINITY_DN2049_c0_g1::TRINITY_DN2049_c0_g1_i1::g.21876  ORF type:complete len:232 (+),score=25.02,sp/Q9LFP1/VA713_ARATH/31.16/1e-34,Synaptobrevin/PF00957.16/7.6e+02,Synaptobrevin/PF00957.16/3.1e-32,Longin/PF13774.1/3.5e+03,Longin/PF13774.1/7.6e-11,ATP-synt_S1/PF05827.7/0.059 TRINITY_DN2049_c0_g1_i1:66-698(+)